MHVTQAVFGAQGFAYVEPRHEIRETMSRACEMLTDAGVTVQGIVAHQGPVATAVAEIAKKCNADLIVIGSSRMGDIGRASAVIASYFAPFNHKPTSTNVAVLELGEPEQLIEIQMFAVVD